MNKKIYSAGYRRWHLEHQNFHVQTLSWLGVE